MKIMHRYLIAGYLGPLIFCTGLFLTMFIFIDSLTNLDEFLKNKAPLFLVCSYYVSMIPIVLCQIIPTAALIAALYFLNHLNRNNEVCAFKASGISGYAILRPILIVGFILSVFVFYLQEKAIPHSAMTSATIQRTILQGEDLPSADQALTNVAILSSGNRMIYARELILKTDTLNDLIVLEHYDDLTLKSKLTARKAVYEGGEWNLYHVIRYQLDVDGNIIGAPEVSDKGNLDIDERPIDFIRQHRDAHFMNYMQLKKHIKDSNLAGFKASNRLLIDLYQKTASPFMAFIILIVGVPAALKIQRGGALISIGIGVSIVGGYYLLIAVCTALGKGGSLHPIAAVWFPHAAFLGLGIYLIRKYM